MNLKTTLVLVVLVAVLGAWAYFASNAPAPEKPEKAEDNLPTMREMGLPEGAGEFRKKTLLIKPAIPTGKVVALKIEKPDGETLAFQRDEVGDKLGKLSDWRITQPVEAEAQGWMIDNLAQALVMTGRAAEFTPGEQNAPTRADAGLEQPRMTISVTERGGRTVVLHVGGNAPLSSNTYVQIDDDKQILLADRDLFAEAGGKKVAEFRSKTLLKFAPPDVKSIEIDGVGGKRFALAHGDANNWVINEPIRAPADANAVSALMSNLAQLSVVDFVADKPESLERYGLAKPHLGVTLNTETLPPPTPTRADGPPSDIQPEPTRKTVGLLVGDFADLQQTTRFIKPLDGDTIATVPVASLESLTPDLAKLRDAKVLPITAASVTQLELSADGRDVTLNRVGGAWQGSGDLASPDASEMQGLLTALEDLRAIDYVDAPGPLDKYGLATPRAVLRIATPSTMVPVEVRVGQATASGRNAYVQVAGQTSVQVVSAAQADRIAISPLALRSRDIFQTDADRIVALQIERDGRKYELTKADARWKLSTPWGDAVPDGAALRDLLNDLSNLRGKQVVAKDAAAEYGLDQPDLRLTFSVANAEMPEQPTSHTLRATRKDGDAYAMLDDDPYVFALDESVWQVLTQEVINRQVIGLASAEINGVRIAAAGGTLEFDHGDEGTWIFAPDPFVKLDQAKVNELVQTLATLKADRYLEYRAATPDSFDLGDNPVTVTVLRKEGEPIELRVGAPATGATGRRALRVDTKSAFVLPAKTAELLLRPLEAYIASEPKPATAQPPRGRPGQPMRPPQGPQ